MAALVAGSATLAACSPETKPETPIASSTPSATSKATVTSTFVQTSEPTQRPTVEMTPVPEKVRPTGTLGVYLPFDFVSRETVVKRLTDNLEKWGANTMVIDVKNARGHVNIPFDHPLKNDDIQNKIDLDVTQRILDWANQNGVYTVARIPVTVDTTLAKSHPELALVLPDGSIRMDGSDDIWLDWERAEEIGDYNSAIAEAAALMGFREIQLDYIRLPNSMFEYPYEYRVERIAKMVSLIREKTHLTQAFLTADLFAETALWSDDGGIGQEILILGKLLDGISPMSYPNLRSDPNGGGDPYKYVKMINEKALAKMLSVNPKGFVCPWIQSYGPLNSTWWIREQLRGAMDAGCIGVYAWNNLINYPEEMYK